MLHHASKLLVQLLLVGKTCTRGKARDAIRKGEGQHHLIVFVVGEDVGDSGAYRLQFEVCLCTPGR